MVLKRLELCLEQFVFLRVRVGLEPSATLRCPEVEYDSRPRISAALHTPIASIVKHARPHAFDRPRRRRRASRSFRY